MACVADVVHQTRREAYAHHIQRLMITGNFALLAGIDPKEVHEWYLSVYADAYEWVELPNTLGMSLFADGGILASKPYAAGGNYISKMSDYCRGCAYDVRKKTGDGACPFNYLYWDFLDRHDEKLRGNPRLGPVYSTWDRMADEKKNAYRESAAAFLSDLKAFRSIPGTATDFRRFPYAPASASSESRSTLAMAAIRFSTRLSSLTTARRSLRASSAVSASRALSAPVEAAARKVALVR